MFYQDRRYPQGCSRCIFKFIYDGEGSILLEVIEHHPNFAFLETGRFVGQNIFGHIFQELVENVIKRHKVDEIGRVLVVCGGNAVNYFISNDLKHLAVIPYLIEVSKQSAGKGLIFHDCCADYIAFSQPSSTVVKLLIGV